MKLGIQTIIFGKRGGEDFPGVLRDIKAAGYDGVEFGYKADQSAEEVKTLLSDNGYRARAITRDTTISRTWTQYGGTANSWSRSAAPP